MEINERLSMELIQKAKIYSAATLHEAAGKKGALPSAIKPVAPTLLICGPAVTVSSPPGDNLMLHRAIYIAQPGDVLVAEMSGHFEAGYWGDLMTAAAQYRKLGGLAIDGCVRDIAAIEKSNFPIFARGLCIRGTSKKGGGSVQEPIRIGDVKICPGDLIVGDRDGVVIIPKSEAAQVLTKAEQRENHEECIRKELAEGKTTLEIHNWE